MIHFATPSYWSAYESLPVSIQKLADRNYEILKENPKHPSLHFWSKQGKEGCPYSSVYLSSFEGLSPSLPSTSNNYKLVLVFTNGERGIYDCSNLLGFGVLKELKDKNYFCRGFWTLLTIWQEQASCDFVSKFYTSEINDLKGQRKILVYQRVITKSVLWLKYCISLLSVESEWVQWPA